MQITACRIQHPVDQRQFGEAVFQAKEQQGHQSLMYSGQPCIAASGGTFVSPMPRNGISTEHGSATNRGGEHKVINPANNSDDPPPRV